MRSKFFSKFGAPAILFLLASILVLLRLHTLHEPLERDLTTYANIGKGILQGKVPYRDLWDHKPPLIYFVYSLFILIFGQNDWSIFAMNIFANIAILLVIYFAVTQLGNKITALWAAAGWTLISGTMALEANQPNSEVFLNLCIALIAFLVLNRLYQEKKIKRFAMWIGLIIGAATLFKYIIIVPIIFMLLVYLIYDQETVREKIVQSLKIFFWAVLPWIIFALYFAANHALPDFYNAVFKFNQYYAGVETGAENSRLLIHTGISSYIKFLAPSLAIIFAMLITLLFSKKFRPAALSILLLLISTPLAISLPGKGFPHYYQLWLTVYCIAFGISLYLFEIWRKDYLTIIGNIFAAFIVASLLWHEYSSYRLPAKQWSEKKYGAQFIQVKNTGLAIGGFLTEEESFFQWGDESGLYWYSKKDPVTPVLHIAHISGGPVAPRLIREIKENIDKQKPDLLVIREGLIGVQYSNSTFQEIATEYEPISETYHVPGFYILPRLNKSFVDRSLQKDLIYPLISGVQ